MSYNKNIVNSEQSNKITIPERGCVHFRNVTSYTYIRERTFVI